MKNAVNKVFSDLYVVLAKYRVRHVIGFESTQEKARLNAKKIAGASLEVLGDGADLESDFRYQGGLDQWIVRCVCGTCDDDGERMIACDVCEVWMHTRCVGISDSENTPRRWTCKECIEDEAEAAKNAPPPPPPHRAGTPAADEATAAAGAHHEATESDEDVIVFSSECSLQRKYHTGAPQPLGRPLVPPPLSSLPSSVSHLPTDAPPASLTSSSRAAPCCTPQGSIKNFCNLGTYARCVKLS